MTKDWSEWAWEKKKTELAAERLRRQCQEVWSGRGDTNLIWGAEIITNTVLGAPYYNYRIMGSQTLF